MSDDNPANRERDADRSREAILDAAEHLFAESGYERTSLQAIGARAGVSRGTPGYFFGSKESLYLAVIDRMIAAELAFVRAAAAGGAPDAPVPEWTEAVDATIGGFLSFLADRPSFVRLLDHEALVGGAHVLNTPVHDVAVSEGLALTESIFTLEKARELDPSLFLLALVSLCWFPFTHRETYARELGIDLQEPADRERWLRFVVRLIACVSDDRRLSTDGA